MHSRGGYIYCKSRCMINTSGWACSAAVSMLSVPLALNEGEYLFGNVELRVSTLKRREAVSIEKSTWWHKQLWGEFITRPRWLLMTYFGCFPWQSSKGGGGRLEWVESKIWRDYYRCRALSAPEAIASKKNKDQKEGRFWLKVWGKVMHWGEERTRRRRGEEEEEKMMERKSKRGVGVRPVLHFISV